MSLLTNGTYIIRPTLYPNQTITTKLCLTFNSTTPGFRLYANDVNGTVENCGFNSTTRMIENGQFVFRFRSYENQTIITNLATGSEKCVAFPDGTDSQPVLRWGAINNDPRTCGFANQTLEMRWDIFYVANDSSSNPIYSLSHVNAGGGHKCLIWGGSGTNVYADMFFWGDSTDDTICRHYNASEFIANRQGAYIIQQITPVPNGVA